jgi:hypothetical protein
MVSGHNMKLKYITNTALDCQANFLNLIETCFMPDWKEKISLESSWVDFAAKDIAKDRPIYAARDGRDGRDGRDDTTATATNTAYPAMVEPAVMVKNVTLLRKSACLEQWSSLFHSDSSPKVREEVFPFMLTADAGSRNVETVGRNC